MAKCSLKIDFVSHDVYKAAIRRWYYRPDVPVGKLVRLGVWEDDRFVGVVSFGPGSSSTLGQRFGCTPLESCELNRIALSSEHKTEVSRIIRIAVLMLRKQSPGIKVIVTFADPQAGHHGGVYQGAGWIYTGKTADDRRYLYRGEWLHSRSVRASGSVIRPGGKRVRCPRPEDCDRVEIVPGKHRYVLALTPEVKALVERARRDPPRPDQSPSSSDDSSTS